MRIPKLVMAALMIIIHMIIIHHHSMKQTSVLRPEGDGDIHQKSHFYPVSLSHSCHSQLGHALLNLRTIQNKICYSPF